jgi:membrane associated rhomboid family serine protease
VLPIKDRNPTSRFAWVTFVLIVLNAIAFLLWEPIFGHGNLYQQVWFFCHAEIPWELTHHTSIAQGGHAAVVAIDHAHLGVNGRALQLVLQGHANRVAGVPPNAPSCPHKNWWESVFVAMFLHGGWLHIGGNMLFLWIFGNNVEDSMGRFTFVGFYLLGGLAATLLQTAVNTSSTVPNLGASGAIAAVLGGYALLYPRARVATLIFIIFFITVLELPALVVLGGWFLLQLLDASASAGGDVGGVAYFAHIGGFLFGLLTIKIFAHRAKDDYVEPRLPVY